MPRAPRTASGAPWPALASLLPLALLAALCAPPLRAQEGADVLAETVVPAAASVAAAPQTPLPAGHQGLWGRFYQPRRGISRVSHGIRQAAELSPELLLRLPKPDYQGTPTDPLGTVLAASRITGNPSRLQQPAGEEWLLVLSGYLVVPRAGLLEGTVRADDGVRIEIAGQQVLLAESDAWDKTYRLQVRFPGAGVYPLRITHFQGVRDFRLSLSGPLFAPGTLAATLPGLAPPQVAPRVPAQHGAQGPLGTQVRLDASPTRAHPEAEYRWYDGPRCVAQGRRTAALLSPGEHRLTLEVMDAGGRSTAEIPVRVAAFDGTLPHATRSGAAVIPASSRVAEAPAARGTGLLGRLWDIPGPFDDFTDLESVVGEEGCSLAFISATLRFPRNDRLRGPASQRLYDWLGQPSFYIGETPLVDDRTLEAKRDRFIEPLGDRRFMEFTGCLRVDEPGEVTFDVNSDDGFQLWVGNQLLGEAPRARLSAWTTMKTRFEAPGLYPLRLRYFQWAGEAGLVLTSSLPGGAEPLGPEGRRVLGMGRLYPHLPGASPLKLSVKAANFGPTQGALGRQVQLAATEASGAGGPVEYLWWADGKRLPFQGPQACVLARPGITRVRVEAWNGGLPVQEALSLTTPPEIRALALASLPGKPPSLTFQVLASNSDPIAPGNLKAELSLRRASSGSGGELVGPRKREARPLGDGRWEHMLRAGELGPGRYTVEVRLTDGGGVVTRHTTAVLVR